MGEFKAPVEQKNKTAAPVQEAKEASSLGEMEYVDSRASTFQLIQLQAAADDQGKGSRITQLQSKSAQFTGFSRVAQLQAKSYTKVSTTQPSVVQREENKTGLPDGLKSGMESISGMSLSDVKVHRNSDKPAQLQAHAYAQGTDIHLGPGQEKHLPHELGHVVQQKEGRVKPTTQLKGKVNINDNSGLEKEADVLGKKAKHLGKSNEATAKTGILQAKGFNSEIVQMVILPEVMLDDEPAIGSGQGLSRGLLPDVPEEDWSLGSREKRLTLPEIEEATAEGESVTEIRDLPGDVKIYGEEDKDFKKPIGTARNLLREYAATQVSKSNWIKNEKGEPAYSVSTRNKALMTAASSAIGAYGEGKEIAEQVKYTMEEGKVQNSAKEAKKHLSAVGGAITTEFNIGQVNAVSAYFSFIEAIDVFGVTNILKSIGSFAFAKKEQSKIEVLKGQLGKAKGSPAFSEDLAEIAEYALGKVARSYYESMATGILEGLEAVTRIVTIATGGIGGLFAEPIRLASQLVKSTISLYHMVKGVFKFFKGTRGVARKNNAERVFNLCAQGNPQGLTFLQDYFKAGLPTLQKLAFEQLRKQQPTLAASGEREVSGNIELFFRWIKQNEKKPEIQYLKSFVIDQIAIEFKSKPPSGGAFLQVLLKHEAVQNGLADVYDKATNS
jgi:hypothetical protein